MRSRQTWGQWIAAGAVAVSAVVYLLNSHAVANHLAFLVEAVGKVLQALK